MYRIVGLDSGARYVDVGHDGSRFRTLGLATAVAERLAQRLPNTLEVCVLDSDGYPTYRARGACATS